MVSRAETGSPEIWRELPLNLQMRLLQRLPLPSLARFQAVSRAWCRGIRALKEITTHGECYLAEKRPRNDVSILVYSSLDKGPLTLPRPTLPGYVLCSCPNGLVCFYSRRNEVNVCHVLTGQVFPVPSPVTTCTRRRRVNETRFLGMQTGEQVGDASIVFVLVNVKTEWKTRSGEWGATVLQVYKQGDPGWEGRVLPLEDGEDVAQLHQATLCGSMLYFLTVRVGSQKVCLRSMDVFKDRVSTKMSTWTSLPRGLRNYGYVTYVHGPLPLPTFNYTMKLNLSTRLVMVQGNLLMATFTAALFDDMRDRSGVALVRFDKQRRTWDFLSQMPRERGFPTFQLDRFERIFITAYKGKVLICNERTASTCTYDVSSNVWSLPLGISTGETPAGAVPFQLSLNNPISVLCNHFGIYL